MFDQFKLFLRDESQEIPENIILYQENLLNNKAYVAKTPEQDQLDIETKYRRFKRLAGTTWFIYFYGYGIKEQDNNENEWTLVKLVLSFTQDNKSKNLKVQIKNSPNNKDHYNYIRKGNETAIEVSGDDVLVINLRTEFNTRQLNLKVHVGDATSSFYLGQYLNYEVNQGHIISGTIIMEQATVDNPLPNVYKFRENFESDPMFLAQIQEIRHVIDFFKDKKINFRRTTTRVNSLETFIAWQNERKMIDIKRLNKYSEKIKMLISKEIAISDMAKIFDVSDVVMSEYLKTINE